MSVATKLLQVLIKSSTSASAKAIEVPAGVGDLGGQVVIKAQGDAKYQLKDLTQNGLGPQMIKAKRLGQNLMITFEDGAVADLVIEDYYSQTSEPAQGLVGQVSDGGLQNYLVENHEAFRNLGQLMDGSSLVDAVLAHSPSMVPVAAQVGVSSLANASAAVGTLGLNPLAAVAGLVGTAATVGTVGAADKAETADKVGTPANGSIPDESLSVSPVNHPVTGSLSISGSAVQGAPFQAVSTLADVDGMGPVNYQWYANGELIEGATGDTFTPGQAHIGKVFTVQASITDALGHTEVVSSALTAAVANVNDALTGDVSISGTPEQYQTLTASHTLADIDGLGDVTYQWQANGQDIPGATGNTFTLDQTHVGQVLTVKASYTDAFGAKEALSSAPTAAVANVNDALTGDVTISGTPEQYQTLTASHTLADIDGLGTVIYQWQANGQDIPGATGNTFTLAQAHVGQVLTVKASYTDAWGAAETLSSAPTAAVANVNDAPEGQMFVGEANKMIQLIEQGSPLQADNNLTDVDGLGEVQYQWYAQGQLIEGANTSTFIPTQAQVNQTLTVKATYTDAMGAVEVVTSTPTYPVLNVNDLPTGDVTIVGTPAQYQTLTASNTLGDTDGMGEVTYQWYADGVVIDGATSETFTLSQAQVGQVLTVQASYTDAFGAEETVTSAPTAVVANVDDAPVHVMPGEHWVLEDLRMPIGDLSVVDEDGNLASTQLSVAHGSLEVSLSEDGAVISLGANGSGSLTLQGTQAQINAALATLTYQGEANFFGTDVLQMVSSDKTGLPLVSTDSLLIEVAPDDDFATSTGDTTGLVVESNAPESVSGQLTLSDIDSVNPLFTAQTYEGDLGRMTVDESGAWTFTAREAFDTAGEGEIFSETFELAAQDGSNHAVEITFQGTNDPALIGGKLSGSLTESETGTTLFGILENIDPDSAAGFAVQNKAGSYGHFKLDIGQSVNYVASWTYDLDAALESLNLGQQVTDRFTIVADDGTESEVVITIHGENDAPVLASSTAVTYAENAAPLPIHTLITVSDVDNATMASATVEISGGYVAGQDVLSFTNVSAATMGNIAGTYANGTMTLSSAGATASKAQWQAALRAVAYSNTSDAPTTTERTIRYEIDDGAQSASPVTSTITVTASNDAAVITGAQTASLTETDAAQSTGGTLNVSDVDSAATFEEQTNTAGSNGYGEFNLSTAGVWTYTMNAAHHAWLGGQTYTDSFTAVTADGTQQSVTVTLSGANDAPVLAATTQAMSAISQNAAVPTGSVGVLVSALVGGQSDMDASPLKGLAITGVNGNGTLYFRTDAGGSWTAATAISDANALLLGADMDNRIYFKPNVGYHGTLSDAITFRAWDQTSGSDGSYASTANNNATGAFSATTDTISLQVVRAVTIDTVSTDSKIILDEALPLSGTAEANATVTVSINGAARTVQADADGDWSYDTQLAPLVRYVMVSRELDTSWDPGWGAGTVTGVFNLDEIKVMVDGVNVAAGKTFKQNNPSGTVYVNTGPGSVTNGVSDIFEIVNQGDTNLTAWVEVDLGGYYRVDTVDVYARESWAGRLDGAQLYTSLTPQNGVPAASGTSIQVTNANRISVTPQHTLGSTEDRIHTEQNGGINTITATQTFSGVTSNDSETVQWMVPDTTPPVFSSGAAVSVPENTSGTVYDAQATDAGGAADVGITYSLGGDDAQRFSIHASTGAVSFVSSPDFEAPADVGANNVYNISILATDSADNVGTQNVAITVTDEVDIGQATIGLGGTYGTLVSPVNIDGRTYYLWNHGVHQFNTGWDALLDNIFKYDINGGLNPNVSAGATETYRYATLNGVMVALPTAGVQVDESGFVAFGGASFNQGTVVNSASAYNNTYSDMLAVWDAYNGAGTSMSNDGRSWNPLAHTNVRYFWTATPTKVDGATSGNHVQFDMQTGNAASYADNGIFNVMVEVLSPQAGDAVITLAAGKGKLINPVEVEGKWYYAWDKNGSGGITAFNYDPDYFSMDELNLIFNKDMFGNTNPSVDTNEVFRFATLKDASNADVKMAIPTYGGQVDGSGYANFYGNHNMQRPLAPQTSISTYGEINPQYDDFAAMLDAGGIPPAWSNSNFMTASRFTTYGDGLPVGGQHLLYLNGDVYKAMDFDYGYKQIALEVVKPNLAPVLADTSLSFDTASSASLPVGTAGLLVSQLTAGVSDIDSADPQGVAIVGIQPGGTLWYSLNGGSTWLMSKDVSAKQALLLGADADNRVFYQPGKTMSGTVTEAITFRAWDRSRGEEGQFLGNDTTINGGASPFSAQTDTVSVTVGTGPVVLDLNGDGTLAYSQVAMDVNGDGHLDNTAWAGAQDGVLVWDKNGDGVVRDASQYAFNQYGGQTDLQGLAAGFDSNADGVFDATDAKFAEFKVWQDANQNGVSDAGEVRSLAEVGLSSINLVSDGVQSQPAQGVSEAGRSTAQLADGGEMLVGDAEFAYSSLAYRINPEGELSYLGEQMDLDLSSLVSVHSGLHSVDLSGTGANSLEISLQDVLSLGSEQPLRVLGDADDRVVLDAVQWTASGSAQAEGHSYAVYAASNGQQLWLEQHIHMA